MKNKSKILTILVILIPYVQIILSAIIYNTIKSLLTYIIMSAILFIIYMFIYVMMILHLVSESDKSKFSKTNLIIKIGYTPFHIILLLLAGAFGNPFLFLFIPVPLFINSFFSILTGIISTICILKKQFKEKKLTKKLIIKILLSYIFIPDIIVAIIEYKRDKDTYKKQLKL